MSVSTGGEMNRRRFLGQASAALFAPAFASSVFAAQDSASTPGFAYVGTNTGAPGSGGNGEGIYRFLLDSRTGALTQRALVAKSASPWWITVHPSRRYLYAISYAKGDSSGAIDAFQVDQATGDLRHLNRVDSCGPSPAHLSIDRTARFLFVANYGDGSIALMHLKENGEIGETTDTRRDAGNIGGQTAINAPPGSFALSGHDRSRAHMIISDPGNRFVLHTDLGEDRIYVDQLNSLQGKLTPVQTAPFTVLPSGDGPRHLAFHPKRSWLYSIQEEASTIDLFDFDSATGRIELRQTISTLPDGFAGTSFASELAISHDGEHLYAANRLHDSIAIFSVGSSGNLTRVGEVPSMGDYPSQFAFSPTNDFIYCCNQKSDCITSFRIDHHNGQLTFTSQYTPVGSPGCIVFL